MFYLSLVSCLFAVDLFSFLSKTGGKVPAPGTYKPFNYLIVKRFSFFNKEGMGFLVV